MRSFPMSRVVIAAGALWCLQTAVGPQSRFGVASPALADGGPRIVHGVFSQGYPTVGALLNGNDPATAKAWCSGTMIGCETFLTASHCAFELTASDFLVFVPQAGAFSVTSITEPLFGDPAYDLAVFKLGAPINGVAPSRINTIVDPPLYSEGTIVGFGRSGVGGGNDFGLKRQGDMSTSVCPNRSQYDDALCWKFTKPVGPPGSHSTTCNGDSGGPMFMDFGSGDVVAGVTSGAVDGTCHFNQISIDGNVYHGVSFIQSAGGADLANTSCGSLPQVGHPLTHSTELAGTLSASTPQAQHVFDLVQGTTVARFAMNAIDDTIANFDLYVKAGSPPTLGDFDCRRDGTGQFGFCEFSAPVAGPWHVLVNRVSGEGSYQLTVTSFERDCAAPGTDGLVCDDDNACTENETCLLGSCVGIPVANDTPCDDGNACRGPDTCQAGTCTAAALADGTPCADGNPCSRPDTCQAGTCVGTSPVLSCKQPFVSGKATIVLKDRVPNRRDLLTWKWNKGSQTSLGDFGTPTVSSAYTFCLYDSIAGIPSLIQVESIPPGDKWTARNTGFTYRDRYVSQGGISSVLLRAGADGEAKVVVQGKAHPLHMPALPLTQQSAVRAQLVNDTTCWEATYSAPAQSNRPGLFNDKSD